MAEQVTVANAYVQIMPSAQDAKANITDAILPAATEAGESAGDAVGAGILTKIQGLKGPLMAVGATLVSAIAVEKIATALMDIGGQFDEMRDIIIVGTGASGEALDALCESAETIATTIPISFGDAGDIVQNINTRMGLTGDELEEVGARIAAAGELIGSSINLDSLTGAFNAFGIAGEDAAAEMDYLWGVSQNTGIGFDQLTSILETNAPALQQLGFSFDEAANLAGTLDRAGMDASSMMGNLSRALVNVAEPGEDASEAFARVVDEIGGYIDAGDEAAALDLATEIFGTKGAAKFVTAIQNGTMSLEDLEDAALGAGDGILGTYEATASWPEQWELLKNKVAAALEPLGGALMDGATKALEKLVEAFDEIDPAVMEELGEALGDVLVVAVDALSTAIDWLVEHKEQIGAFFAAIGDAINTVLSVVVPFVGTVIQKFAEVKAKVVATWETLKVNVSNAVSTIKTKVITTFENVRSTVVTKWNAIKSAITTPINSARDAVKNAIDKIKNFFNFSVSWPHIPLPHFGISPSGWSVGDLLKGVIPSLSISWYGKGGFVNTPQLYAVGVGERGGELVWPSYEPYLSKYASAIAGEMGKQGGGVTNNYYIDGNLVAADPILAAALDTVGNRVGNRRRMGSVR